MDAPLTASEIVRRNEVAEKKWLDEMNARIDALIAAAWNKMAADHNAQNLTDPTGNAPGRDLPTVP